MYSKLRLLLALVHLLVSVIFVSSSSSTTTSRVVIAGLFSYNISEVARTSLHRERTANGSVVQAAVEMAISAYNSRPSSQLNLTLWPYSTECDPARALWSISDILRRSDPQGDPVVILGPPCDDSTNDLVRLTSSSTNLISVSYAATTPQVNNATFFRNFFRTVPSYSDLNAALKYLLLHFDWENVCIVLESQPYYNTAAEAFQYLNLTIIQSIPPALLEFITTNSYCHIFIVYAQPKHLPSILCQAYNNELTGEYYQWIFLGNVEMSDLITEEASLNCSQYHLQMASQSSLIVNFNENERSSSSDIGLSRQGFEDQIKSALNMNVTRKDLIAAASAYDAAWAIAVSLNETAVKLRETNQSIRDYVPLGNKDVSNAIINAFESVSFKGVSTTVNFTNANHNTPKAIAVSQVQDEELVDIGLYTAAKLNMSYFGNRLKWIGEGPPRDRPVQLSESVPLWAQVLMFATSGLGSMALVLFLVVNLYFREKKVIKASSPHINTLILFGCLLGLIAVSTYTLTSIEGIKLHTRSAFCNTTLWLVNIMFTLSFGALLAKTWRVGAVFRNPWSKRRIYKDYVLFIIVLILLAVDVLILTIWMTTSPLYISVRIIRSPSAIKELSFCSLSGEGVYFSFLVMVYKCILLLLGCFLATQTRGITATLFNDSKYIAVAIYTVFLIVIIGLPMAIFFILSRYVLLGFFAMTLTIAGLSFTISFVLFIPKLILLYKTRKDDTFNVMSSNQKIKSHKAFDRKESLGIMVLLEYKKTLSQKNSSFFNSGSMQMSLSISPRSSSGGIVVPELCHNRQMTTIAEYGTIDVTTNEEKGGCVSNDSPLPGQQFETFPHSSITKEEEAAAEEYEMMVGYNANSESTGHNDVLNDVELSPHIDDYYYELGDTDDDYSV